VIGLGTRATKVFAYPAPVDLRKGYDGLAGLVTTGLLQNVLDGALFLFVGRTRTICKILHWDGTGLCLFAKRLERGRFAALWRANEDFAVLPAAVTLSASELALFVEGCTVVGKQTLTPKALSFKK
jgi:transposase